MRYELFIALRYLFTRRKEKFISIITIISILGVAVGVGALIATLAVMSGFSSELQARVIGSNPHIFIESEFGIQNPQGLSEAINSIEGVKGSFPYIWSQGIVEFRNRKRGIVLRSVDTKNEIDASKLLPHIVSSAADADIEDGLIMGSEIASLLGVYIDDEVVLVTPESNGPKKIKVTGIFKSGMYDYDSNIAYIGLNKMSAIFEGKAVVSGIGVDCLLPANCDKIKRALQESLKGNFSITTWADRNRNLFSAIKLEKLAMFVILTLIVVVACFSIVAVLVMMVLEKAKDIGILKSIGASKKGILAIFSLQGLIIGSIGTGLGFLGGVGVSFLLKEFFKLPPDIYYIDYIPVKFNILDSVVIALAALIISLLASVYPAYQASRLDPVQALKYE
ncbi:MAG: ABC transporter permease [Candidatus Omnitrophota bacterium]